MIWFDQKSLPLIIAILLLGGFISFLLNKLIKRHTFLTGSKSNEPLTFKSPKIASISSLVEEALSEKKCSIVDSLGQIETAEQSAPNNNFNSIQSDIFKYVNGNFIAETLSKSNEMKRFYFVDLKSICKQGIFMIAPMNNFSSHQSPRKRLNLLKKIYSKSKSRSQKVLDFYRKNIHIAFEMSAIQQKHFLAYFGQKFNPLYLANKACKHSKATRDDILFENFDINIRNYLQTACFNDIHLKHDESCLGHHSLVQLRQLELKTKSDEPLPQITFSIYDTISEINIDSANSDESRIKMLSFLVNSK